jgi:TonB family protein
MKQQFIIQSRRNLKRKSSGKRILKAAFAPASGGALPALAFPGYADHGDDDGRRTAITGSISTLLHALAFGFLLLMASLAPVLDETLIPVQLLRDDPQLDEPAPAPKALSERRSLNYAPAAQTVAPQIVNPRVIAAASAAVEAEALQMDAVSSVTAPTAIDHSTTVVERVSAVNSVARARVAAVDVTNAAAPVVRGPTQANSPVGPSVGPRQVEAADAVPTMGTGPLKIGGGNGSSVREGVLSHRDVLGSPGGTMVVSVDTTIGNSHLRGSGGEGTSLAPGGTTTSQRACLARPEVAAYMDEVKTRMFDRWKLPPGLESDQKVTLRFRLDAAGSATSVSLVKADNNAMGASAVDALHAASPFPPMSDQVRCLSQHSLIGTFSNPFAG